MPNRPYTKRRTIRMDSQRNFQISKDKLLTAPITAFLQFETSDGKMP